MKNSMLITSLFILFSFTTLHAQWWNSNSLKGNGEVTTKTLQTTAYEGLAVAGFYKVTLVEGIPGKISLTGESNLLEAVVVEVKDNVLHIKTEKNVSLKPSIGKTIEVTVPAQQLSKIALAGSGEVKNNFNLKTEDLLIKLAGSGTIKLNIETSQLETKVSGSGDLILNGIAANVEGSLAGSGSIDASRLQAKDASIKVAGSGDIIVNCQGQLKARVSGSGKIKYLGNPNAVDSKVAGSGKIKKVQ